jgi:hypothetical protein
MSKNAKNCPIRGTASQFPLFIEWRPLDWQVFARGVAQWALYAGRVRPKNAGWNLDSGLEIKSRDQA